MTDPEKKAAYISSIIVLTILCIYSYVNAPDIGYFYLDSINPINTFSSLTFIFGLGLKVPENTAIMYTIISTIGFWLACFALLNRLFDYIEDNFPY